MLDIKPLNNLRNLYCALRIYRRNQSRTRFYYRKIKQEKLRLVEGVSGMPAALLPVFSRWQDLE